MKGNLESISGKVKISDLDDEKSIGDPKTRNNLLSPPLSRQPLNDHPASDMGSSRPTSVLKWKYYIAVPDLSKIVRTACHASCIADQAQVIQAAQLVAEQVTSS